MGSWVTPALSSCTTAALSCLPTDSTSWGSSAHLRWAVWADVQLLDKVTCDNPINVMDPSQTACKPRQCDALQTESLASFHSESWILLNTGIPVWSCLGFYHVVCNPFSPSKEVPNHSGPIFQHHRWLRLQSHLPHESEIFVSHLSVILGGSLAFQTFEQVLKLPASQVPQMAVPHQVWPTQTALTEIQHSLPATPILQDNATI